MQPSKSIEITCLYARKLRRLEIKRNFKGLLKVSPILPSFRDAFNGLQRYLEGIF